MLKRINHVGVVVDDLEEGQRFLEGVLGLSLQRTAELEDQGLKAAFYRCGEVDIELIEISEPDGRKRRLGANRARIEHIAFEVDNLEQTLDLLGRSGVRPNAAEPLKVGDNLNVWTQPETCDGVMYQLIQKGSG
jgi:methylmalonyl-CoA/ethylmalonyl-CoA epimerase